MRTADEATLEVAREILADPEWTSRVVLGAIWAQTELSRHRRGWPGADPQVAEAVLDAVLAAP